MNKDYHKKRYESCHPVVQNEVIQSLTLTTILSSPTLSPHFSTSLLLIHYHVTRHSVPVTLMFRHLTRHLRCFPPFLKELHDIILAHDFALARERVDVRYQFVPEKKEKSSATEIL
jgi:hypothetical protein